MRITGNRKNHELSRKLGCEITQFMVALWKGGVHLPVIKKGIEVYKGMPGWDSAVKCFEV